MIREFNTEDKEQLIKIIKQGIVIVGQDYVDLINGEANRIIVYYDNESELTGFASLKIWGSDKKNGEVFTYVAPGSRRKGIGSLLYNEIMRYAIDLKLNLIDTGFRVDKDDSTLFYKKLGYEKWYGLHDMHYDGLEQPKSDMKFVSYEDKYFEQYVEGLRTSFYEMRRIHDFQPHLCCEFNKEKREELISSKDNIFLLFVNGNLTGSVKVNDNGSLGPIFIVPSYQGNGYGRIITQFAINEAIYRGKRNITLDVVEWNVKALNLYLSLGFNIIQTTHYYRLFNF